MSKTLGIAQRLSEAAQYLRSSNDWMNTDTAIDIETGAAELRRLHELLNTPHTAEFLKAVHLEAMHQRERWSTEHDAGKTDADWFWLVGYLTGKALHKPEKQLHHIIATAAALLNWHAARDGVSTAMRPGIDLPDWDKEFQSMGK